jgi:hypothetical protein
MHSEQTFRTETEYDGYSNIQNLPLFTAACSSSTTLQPNIQNNVLPESYVLQPNIQKKSNSRTVTGIQNMLL